VTAVYLRRWQHGFIPDTAEDWETCKRFKLGEVVKAEVVHPRNLKFHRKFFALIQVGFDLWEEVGVRAQYKGEEVRPNIERFRKDVTILAGHAKPVVNLRGEVRMEADSIAFGKMDEETFEKLFSATIDVILRKVLRGKVPEARLREMVDAVLEFA
jgi:uncharacterized protein DUF1367